MKKNIPVITIDGPSGTGKGTLCQLLARSLGFHLLDSGSLYRVLALAARQHAVSLDNEDALEVLAAHLDTQFSTEDARKSPRIILEGEDVSDALRTEECGEDASKLAVFPKVRHALLERQRAYAETPGLVTDGRDMGTVVFPQAILKIFLSASREIRSERRYSQLKEKGINASLAQVVAELANRDQRDRGRQVSPLVPASDAIEIDTTSLSIDEVLRKVLAMVHERLADDVSGGSMSGDLNIQSSSEPR
jgi:cytidylate kinase